MPRLLRSPDFFRGNGLRWPTLKIVFCLCLFLLWSYWFCFATIGVYEVSDSSQIEVSQEIHVVQAETAGRVSSSFLTLGKPVNAGELLLELDDSQPRLELNEMRARLEGIRPQLDHLYQEIANQQAALHHESKELNQAQREAEWSSRQAESRAAFAKRQAQEDRQLYAIGTLSRREADRTLADANEQAATVERAHASLAKTTEQGHRNREERLANIESLQTRASSLQADLHTLAAQVTRLQRELERRRIYAPVAGILAEVEQIKAGMFVQTGQKVATIMPSGEIRVIAQFLPEAVAGRVKVGQPARLLVDRFSWSQYGAVPLTVQTVGTDVQDSRIRVELQVNHLIQSNIPLQHGLRGTTEVLVERATPLTVALRMVGGYLGGHSRSSPGISLALH